jgi:hypothetical protein
VGGEFDEAETVVGGAAEEVVGLDCDILEGVGEGVEGVGGRGGLGGEGGLEG